MKKPIKVGVVGCGYWGPNLIRNLRGLGDCQMQVMCDVREERLRALHAVYPEVEATTDFNELLAPSGPDAIVIACPVRFHHTLAKQSLEAGKHTFIEKPMARSVAECEELLEIAQAKGLVLMVGHTFLYSAPVRKMKELVESGAIGFIQYMSCRRLNLGLFQKDINVAWDLAPHDISIVLYIMGDDPVSVNCQGNSHISKGIEDVSTMCLNFSHDRCATIQNSWLDPRKVREMTIVGTKRMIVYDDVAPLEKIKIYDARVEAPPHYNTFAEFQYSYHYGDIYAPCIRHEEPLKVECQHFIDCILEQRTPLTDGQQGLELVRILEGSSQSMKHGGAAVPIEARASSNGNGRLQFKVPQGEKQAVATIGL